MTRLAVELSRVLRDAETIQRFAVVGVEPWEADA